MQTRILAVQVEPTISLEVSNVAQVRLAFPQLRRLFCTYYSCTEKKTFAPNCITYL